MFVDDSDDGQATALNKSVLQNIACSAFEHAILVTDHRYGTRRDEARHRRSGLSFLPTLFPQQLVDCYAGDSSPRLRISQRSRRDTLPRVIASDTSTTALIMALSHIFVRKLHDHPGTEIGFSSSSGFWV